MSDSSLSHSATGACNTSRQATVKIVTEISLEQAKEIVKDCDAAYRAGWNASALRDLIYILEQEARKGAES